MLGAAGQQVLPWWERAAASAQAAAKLPGAVFLQLLHPWEHYKPVSGSLGLPKVMYTGQ